MSEPNPNTEPTSSKPSSKPNSSENNLKDSKSTITSAILAAMPLSIAVTPWGILCGTLCIESGLTPFQAQLMSLAVFAGAAQLAGVAIFGAGGSWMALLNSTSMISVRHVLYSAAYKDDVSPLPLWKRILFAFLLTDEMFAIAKVEQLRTGRFDYWYAVITGFTFYLIWNMATFAGIFFAGMLDDIDSLGFDFAIVATFIAMIVPMIKSELTKDIPKSRQKESPIFTHPMIVAVTVSAMMALLFAYLNVKQGLIFATLIGMFVGAFLNRNHIPIEKDEEKDKNQDNKTDNNQTYKNDKGEPQ